MRSNIEICLLSLLELILKKVLVNTCPLLVTHLTKFELKKPTSYTASETKIRSKIHFMLKVIKFRNYILVPANLPKKQRNFCKDFCPGLLRGPKNKGILFTTLDSPQLVK